MLIFVPLSLSSLFLPASFCTRSSNSAPASFRIPVFCQAKRSSFMMASPPWTSRAISDRDALCTSDIESHVVSKSVMAVMAREYLPTNQTNARKYRESV